MKKQMTVGKRLTLGFAVVLFLTVIMGAVSFVGVSKLRAARDVLSARTADASVAAKVPYWTIKQYQNQADLIINRDLRVVDDFEASAKQMDDFRDRVAEMVDTPEEKAWFAQLCEADQSFDQTFHEKVVPEIQHELQDYIGQYDAETDTLIGACEEAANKLEASIKAELDEAAAASNDELLKKRVEQLLAVKNLNFWMIKQYQNQADLIINRNLDSAKDFAESAAMMDRYKEEVVKAVDTEEEKALLAQINQLDSQFDGVFNDKVLPEVKRILENRIRQYDDESDAYMTLIEEMATKIADSLTAEAQEASASFDRIQAIVRTLVLTFSIACIVLGSVIAFALIRSLVRSLGQIIESLSQGSEQVAAASGQVSSASQSLAEGATEQAAGLEETSSSLEEMASMTRQNADNAQQANALAAEAHKAADTGAESMSRMNQAIQQIQKSSDETAKIIKVIDEIAFQTNLLALNAAVEAARAGEAGKGFAVVAEEVRNLAMRSAEAAKNTSNMIEESVKNARNGVDIAGEVGTALEEIVQSVGKTTNLIGEIAAASQEQAQGIDQVNTAVSQMDKVTQQNAANAEESASASEELSSQAESMNAIVGELTALVGRAGSASPSPHGTRPTRRTEVKQSKGYELHPSDAAWHRIADDRAARQAIPLGPDDDELNDFNT